MWTLRKGAMRRYRNRGFFGPRTLLATTGAVAEPAGDALAPHPDLRPPPAGGGAATELGPASVLETERAIAHLRELSALVEEETTLRSTARRDARFRRLLGVADVLGAVVALAVTQLLTSDIHNFLVLYLGLPIVVLISKTIGLYDREELVLAKSTLNEAPSLFHLATLYTLLITALAGPVLGGSLQTRTIIALWSLLFLCVLAGRALARQLARRTTPAERCLVLGSEAQAVGAQAKFATHDGLHARIVAYLPFGEFELSRPRVSGAAFASYIAERDIQRVIIAYGDSHESVLEAVRYFKAYHLKVSVLPTLLEAVGSSVEFDEVHGTTLLGVKTFGLSRSSRLLKRGFDLAGSTLLLVLASPLLLAIVIGIRTTSRGPALFRQTRVGRGGRQFTMLKFRTMYADAELRRSDLDELNETSGVFKLADDPRVTRIGRQLRRTSLDELPQLVNVMRGEMSLVGPRPLIVEEDARVEGWHRDRLRLKPGMTGAWQIMGSTRLPLEEMAVMDYLYIVNWSLWSDTKILLQTAPHVFGRRGL